MTETGCSGARIHGATVVATAVAHGVASIVTANVVDFVALESGIRVRQLAEVAQDSA